MSLVRIGTIALAEAKNLQAALSRKGVELVLDHNDSTCSRGCAVTVEMLAAEGDIPTVVAVFKDEFAKLAAGLDVDWERLNQVYDPSQAEAVCPACGARFSTQLRQCPDCELCF